MRGDASHIDNDSFRIGHTFYSDIIWLVLSDEQTSKSWLFCSLNDEQMSNWVGVKHLPAIGSAKGCQYMMFGALSEE